MYVCICQAVTDKQIRRAATRGADNLRALSERLGVAAGCGNCADHAQSILDEAKQDRFAQPTTYFPAPA